MTNVLPSDAYDKSYTWSSDNTSVATVDKATGTFNGSDFENVSSSGADKIQRQSMGIDDTNINVVVEGDFAKFIIVFNFADDSYYVGRWGDAFGSGYGDIYYVLINGTDIKNQLTAR